MWPKYVTTPSSRCARFALSDARSPDPVQRIVRHHATEALSGDRLHGLTDADADLGTTEVHHATPPGRPVPGVVVVGEASAVLGALIGPGADVSVLDAVGLVTQTPLLVTSVVGVAGPAGVAGLGPPHLQHSVAVDVDGPDGLGVVDAGGVCRVEPGAAITVAVLGGTGVRRTDRDGSRDECKGDEGSSYELHIKPSSCRRYVPSISHGSSEVIHKYYGKK